MKVSAILKGKPDQFGRLPIAIRVNEGDKRTYYTTPFRSHPNDFKNGQLINDEATNTKIRQLAIRHESNNLEGKRKYRDQEFFSYVDHCLKEWAVKRAYNTMRNYKAEKTKLKAFRSSFKLSQVTPELLKDYSIFLHKEKYKPTTIWSSFKFIRVVILKAVREKVIEENPFNFFKIDAYKDPQRDFLTKAEVAKIEKFLPKSGSLKLCATWFVIGCYTGLRYSDMNAFDKEKNIRAGRLVLTTVKTKEIVSMSISPRVRKLLDSINYQPMFISNQKFNSALKKIGEKVELPELTVHKARHTFGVMCAAAGISQEVTAKLMGHRKLATTSIYYKISNPRIDKELKKLG